MTTRACRPASTGQTNRGGWWEKDGTEGGNCETWDDRRAPPQTPYHNPLLLPENSETRVVLVFQSRRGRVGPTLPTLTSPYVPPVLRTEVQSTHVPVVLGRE